MARVQLLGAKELIGQFQALGEAVATRYVERSLQSGAEVIRDSELRKIWRRTGKLQNNLSNIQDVEVTRNRVVKTLSIGPEGFYWRFLEKGTIHRRGPKAGQVKLTADPRLAQAFRNRKTTATQTIRDTFRDYILGFEG